MRERKVTTVTPCQGEHLEALELSGDAKSRGIVVKIVSIGYKGNDCHFKTNLL